MSPQPIPRTASAHPPGSMLRNMAAPTRDEFRRRRITAARPGVDACQRDALLERIQDLQRNRAGTPSPGR